MLPIVPQNIARAAEYQKFMTTKAYEQIHGYLLGLINQPLTTTKI